MVTLTPLRQAIGPLNLITGMMGLLVSLTLFIFYWEQWKKGESLKRSQVTANVVLLVLNFALSVTFWCEEFGRWEVSILGLVVGPAAYLLVHFFLGQVLEKVARDPPHARAVLPGYILFSLGVWVSCLGAMVQYGTPIGDTEALAFSVLVLVNYLVIGPVNLVTLLVFQRKSTR